jgi:hypothetical protein
MPLPKLDVPIYEAKLISDGRVVKFRPFLVKEQKLLLMANHSDDLKESMEVIKQVLNNCILTENIKVDDLATFDLEYLFLQLRAKSVEEVVKLRYTCNNDIVSENGESTKCGGVVKFDLNLQEITPTKNENHTNKIELTPKLGVVMKYPTFNLIEKVENSEDLDIFEMMLDCVDYIYDEDNIYYAKDHTKEELMDFFENMKKEDFQKIELFFQTMPKLKKDLDFKCPKCGYEEQITLEGIQSFFG